MLDKRLCLIIYCSTSSYTHWEILSISIMTYYSVRTSKQLFQLYHCKNKLIYILIRCCYHNYLSTDMVCNIYIRYYSVGNYPPHFLVEASVTKWIIIVDYYILSSNKGIFVWPIWPEKSVLMNVKDNTKLHLNSIYCSTSSYTHWEILSISIITYLVQIKAFLYDQYDRK
jgi:hypothetical protein